MSTHTSIFNVVVVSTSIVHLIMFWSVSRCVDLFNMSPGQKAKRQRVDGVGTFDGVGSLHFSSSSSKESKKDVSRLDQYEMIQDDNGEAVITVVQQHEGGAAAESVASEAGSAFSV